MSDASPAVPSASSPFGETLAALFAELVDGAPPASGSVLNGGDAGLLRSLDRLSAEEASRPSASGGGSVAAHVEHVRYGLSLLNRAAAGEHPFDDADWSASWRLGTVTDAEWAERRRALAAEARQWRAALADAGDPVARDPEMLRVMVASVAHLAYHMGAVRQLAPAAAGPAATD